ncbi:hypothetical protein KRR40_19660 [Niabella defluvii]|nr:hypothetical protein KRR40_19660 [Niabella sp. I65]
MKAYAFDNKHQATFYRSNDNWQQGREISWRNMIKIQGRALIMAETTIGSEVKIPTSALPIPTIFIRFGTF